MKKIYMLVGAVCLLLIVFGGISVAAQTVTDPERGITYEITYQNTYYGKAMATIYDKVASANGDNVSKVFYTEEFVTVPIESPQVQKQIEEGNAAAVEWLQTYEGEPCRLEGSWLVDGNERVLPDNHWYLWKLFDVDKTFSGQKKVMVEGFTFLIKGDGKGRVTKQLLTDVKGKHTGTITIKGDRDIDLEEGFTETYSVWYYKKDSATPWAPDGQRTWKEFHTLKEALDHCAVEAAHEGANIVIAARQNYYARYTATWNKTVEWFFEYGNTDDSVPKTTTTQKKSATTTIKGNTTIQGTNTTDNGGEPSAQPTTTSTTTLTGAEETGISIETSTTITKAEADTALPEDDVSLDDGTVVWWIVGTVAVCVIGAGVWIILHKRKNT